MIWARRTRLGPLAALLLAAACVNHVPGAGRDAGADRPRDGAGGADGSADVGGDEPADAAGDGPADAADAPGEKSDVPADKPDAADVPKDVVELPPPPDVGKDTPPVMEGSGLSACPTGEPAPPAPPCMDACGNDTRDSCMSCPVTTSPPMGDPPCTSATEACDGSDTGGETCESQGFAPGGLIACGGWCAFDGSACDACEPGGAAICTKAALTTVAPSSLAIAGRPPEIGVAWLGDRAADGTSRVRFARFTESLMFVDEVPCLGGTTRTSYALALAATTKGYLLAVATASGLDVRLLDDKGGEAAKPFVIPDAGYPHLVHAPKLGTLLGFDGKDGYEVMLIDEEGKPAWRVPLVGGVIEPQFAGLTHTEDGFMVAVRSSGGIIAFRVEADGFVSSKSEPVGSSTEYPQLAWMKSTGDTAITWADFSLAPATVFFARIDKDGSFTVAPTPLGAVPDWYNETPIQIVDGRPQVLMSGHSGGTGRASQLATQRLEEGGAGEGIVRLDREPYPAFDYQLAPYAEGVTVAGWLSGADIGDGRGWPGRIELALLKI